MSNTTTVPHLVLENNPEIKAQVTQEVYVTSNPTEEQLIEEHNKLYPVIMRDFKEAWLKTCDEVDEGIASGTLIFNSENGLLTKV